MINLAEMARTQRPGGIRIRRPSSIGLYIEPAAAAPWSRRPHAEAPGVTPGRTYYREYVGSAPTNTLCPRHVRTGNFLLSHIFLLWNMDLNFYLTGTAVLAWLLHFILVSQRRRPATPLTANRPTDHGDPTMSKLVINDLAVSKDLDRTAVMKIRGGFTTRLDCRPPGSAVPGAVRPPIVGIYNTSSLTTQPVPESDDLQRLQQCAAMATPAPPAISSTAST